VLGFDLTTIVVEADLNLICLIYRCLVGVEKIVTNMAPFKPFRVILVIE